jgi:hypothetical protein
VETGKLFPVTDRARTVLDALLGETRRAGVELLHPRRVEAIRRAAGPFVMAGAWGELEARRVVLATGGRSLPKSGSDGHGLRMAQSLGHSLTPRVFPALVPLLLRDDSFLRELAGITLPATIEVRSGSDKRVAAFTDSTLLTHFGLSGPSVLDISRYYLDAVAEDPDARLVANWLPDETVESLDGALRSLGKRSAGRTLAERLPERFARELCAHVGVDPSAPGSTMRRESRRALSHATCAMELPVTGDRGWNHAEVTAGGVPLAEVRLETMESRACPGLFLCGEMLDVDGRIGGYNFQWAWSSAHVAGMSGAAS